ncbi:alpha-crystallin B chain [Eurytemora carolleeae]|uniref:alpha-crystallin B chain n=1 Tax=Eurytemora carolleeae TaxID=1294199 RepID=UPI000C77DFBD|nr:alpha-crystallin B chain [Eurytemora carolleeae]|eukprot:XP_023334421.1 alpha-crystallin B chain-like [Eurytemora affinis]
MIFIIVASGEGGKWHVLLDVQHFSPAELSVRTVEQVLEVEGKHEEKEDAHGVVSRHFCRKYIIPSEFEPESATSGISKDGILTITVDRKPLEKPKPSSRSVPIHTREEASATMD